MKPEYWHGVSAALEGCIFDFKKDVIGRPDGKTKWPPGFIEGYTSVLKGEHFGWGDQEHLFDDSVYKRK
jgi:hypothetical protein